MATSSDLEKERESETERLQETDLGPAGGVAVGKVIGGLMAKRGEIGEFISIKPPYWDRSGGTHFVFPKPMALYPFNTEHLLDEELDVTEERSDMLLALVNKRKEKKANGTYERPRAEERIERRKLEAKWTQEHAIMYYEDTWDRLKREVNNVEVVDFDGVLRAHGIPTPPIFRYEEGSNPTHISDKFHEPSTLPIFNAPSVSIVADYQFISIEYLRVYVHLVRAIEWLEEFPVKSRLKKYATLRQLCVDIKYKRTWFDKEQATRLSGPLNMPVEKILRVMNRFCKEEDREKAGNKSQTDSGEIADSSLQEHERSRSDKGQVTSGCSSNWSLSSGSPTLSQQSDDSEEATDTDSGIGSQEDSSMDTDEGDAPNILYCQSYSTPIHNNVPPPCWIYERPPCITCAIEKKIRGSSEKKEWSELRLGYYESVMLNPINFCSPVPHEFAIGTTILEKYEVRHISSQIFQLISGAFMDGIQSSLSPRQRKLYNHISGEEVDDEQIRGFNLIRKGRTIQYFWKKGTEEDDAGLSIIDDTAENGDAHEQTAEHETDVKSYCQVFGTPITNKYPPACLVYSNMKCPLCIPCSIKYIARQCRLNVDSEEEFRSYAHQRLFNTLGTFKAQEPVEFENGHKVGNWEICKIPTSRFIWIKHQIQYGSGPLISEEEKHLYWILSEQYDRREDLAVCNTIEEGRTIQFLVRNKSRIQNAAAVRNKEDGVQSEKEPQQVSDQQHNGQGSCSSANHNSLHLGPVPVNKRPPRKAAQKKAGSPVQANRVTRATSQIQKNRRIPRARAVIPPSDRVLRPRAATKQAIPVVARQPIQRRRNAQPRNPPRTGVASQYQSGQIFTRAQVDEFLAQNTSEVRVEPLTQAQIDDALGRGRTTRRPLHRQRAVARQQNPLRRIARPVQPRNVTNQNRRGQVSTRAPRQPRRQAQPTPARRQRAAQPQVLRRSERIRKQRSNL